MYPNVDPSRKSSFILHTCVEDLSGILLLGKHMYPNKAVRVLSLREFRAYQEEVNKSKLVK